MKNALGFCKTLLSLILASAFLFMSACGKMDYNIPPGEDFLEKSKALAVSDREGFMDYFLTETSGLSEEELSGMSSKEKEKLALKIIKSAKNINEKYGMLEIMFREGGSLFDMPADEDFIARYTELLGTDRELFINTLLEEAGVSPEEIQDMDMLLKGDRVMAVLEFYLAKGEKVDDLVDLFLEGGAEPTGTGYEGELEYEISPPEEDGWQMMLADFLKTDRAMFENEFIKLATDLNPDTISELSAQQKKEITCDALTFLYDSGQPVAELMDLYESEDTPKGEYGKYTFDVNVPEGEGWRERFAKLMGEDLYEGSRTFLYEVTDLSQDKLDMMNAPEVIAAAYAAAAMLNDRGEAMANVLQVFPESDKAYYAADAQMIHSAYLAADTELLQNTAMKAEDYDGVQVFKKGDAGIEDVGRYQAFTIITDQKLDTSWKTLPYAIITDGEGNLVRTFSEYDGSTITVKAPKHGYEADTRYMLSVAYVHSGLSDDCSDYFDSVADYTFTTAPFEEFYPNFNGTYIHQKTDGFTIVTKLPDGVDSVNYYDESGEKIGTSSKTGDFIEYKTDRDSAQIKVVPVMDNREREDGAKYLNANKNASKSNVHMFYDPLNCEELTLSYYIPDEKSYELALRHALGENLLLIETDVLDYAAYNAAGKKLDLEYLGFIPPEDIQWLDQGERALRIEKPEFPLYIDLTVKAHKKIDGDLHMGKFVSYFERDFFAAENEAFVFYGDLKYDLYLSIPDDVSAYSYYGQTGDEYKHTDNRKTFYDYDRYGGLFIADFFEDGQKLEGHDFEVKYVWPRFMGSSDFIFSSDFIDGTVFTYQLYFDDVHPLEYSSVTTVAMPGSVDLPLHPTITVFMNQYRKNGVDQHGINRVWSSIIQEGEEAAWMTSGAIADATYYIKSMTGRCCYWWLSADQHNAFDVHFKDNVGKPNRHIAMVDWEKYMIENRIGGDDYLWIRQSTMILVAAAMDVMLYCSTGGEVKDMLKVWGEVIRRTPEGEKWKVEDFFDAAKKYSDYDFSNLMEKYIFQPADINADYVLKEVSDTDYGVYVLGDYSDERVEISAYDEKNISIKGKALHDTWIELTLDGLPDGAIKKVTVDGKETEVVPYYLLSNVVCIPVGEGDYEIEAELY